MKNWGRRIGTAIGTGLIWLAAWSGAGFLVAQVAGLDSDLPFAYLFAPFAFVTGILFSCIFMGMERRRTLDRASFWRVAAWGAVSGLLLSTIFPALRGNWGELVVFAPSLAVVSAIAAAGSLALARRVETRELAGQ